MKIGKEFAAQTSEKMREHSPEIELDTFIDSLNKDCNVKESHDPKVAELQFLARRVKNIRPLPEPREEFTRELQQKLLRHSNGKSFTHTKSYSRKRFLPWTALIASFLAIIIFFVSPWSPTNKDIVLAMEQSVKKLSNYHGILEKVSTNAAGERQLIQRTEIWSEGSKYATRSEEGVVTVNNGIQRWKSDPNRKELTILPLYLDPHDFDLQKEAANALKYPHKTIGEELISGRKATRIEITPPGGLPYSLWIDQETHLPIQLQTAMQKSLQTTYTFVSLETNIPIPDSTFSYKPPEGYRILDQNPDKLVASLNEAVTLSGLTPVETTEKPQRLFASPNRIVFDYEDTIVIETKANAPFVLNPLAALGQGPEGPLEVLPDRLRWQQIGLEIQVQGQRFEELAKQLTNNLVMPKAGQSLPKEPQIKAEIDLDVVKRNQQQVDAGSSPWQLDPAQVAFTYANLQISPNGMQGEPPIPYDSLKVISNNGVEAVIEFSEGPIKTVYVKRLVRQDSSGIWTAVGHDPR